MRAMGVLFAVSTALWLVAWGSFDVKDTTPARCDPQCGLNGICNNGTCVCSPGWQGDQCQNCQGRIRMNGTNGTISDGPINYTSSAKCTWLIDNNTTQPVRLRLEHFVTECSWDHVYVYDGDGVYGPQLAAFSGSMNSHGDRSVEVTANSGKAFIYFYSDLAFNMSGFEISYNYNSCPLNCSKHGTCVNTGQNATCICNKGYTGAGCETLIGDCQNGATQLANGTCICGTYFRGPHCEIPLADAFWETVDVSGRIPSARASHAAVAVNNTIWVFGGMRFTGQPQSDDILSYDVELATWTLVDVVGPKPSPRYDHSVVYYKGKFYMFGGVVEERNITNQLWSFDPSTKQWTLETTANDSANSRPYAVAGHTAHVIDGVMHVIFGYNIYRGYLHVVQEYSFAKTEWTVPDTIGLANLVTGTFGHSSAVMTKEKTELILVHGGYYAPDTSAAYAISDRLYQYNPKLRKWTTLTASGNQLFRHAIAVINDILIVVGGNAHNESTPNRLTDCYSAKTMAYDIQCDSWFHLNVDSSLAYPGLDRYGHSATLVDNRVFVFGGFNGQMLSDVVKFTPGDCQAYDSSPSDCLNANQGIKCNYDRDSTNGQLCLPLGSSLPTFRDHTKSPTPALNRPTCPSPTSEQIHEQTCLEKTLCTSCLADGGCVWCGDACRTTCGSRSSEITEPSKCSDQKTRQCNMIFECTACQEEPFCRWHMTESRVGCMTIKEEEFLIREQKRLDQNNHQVVDQESSPIHTSLSMATNVLSLNNATCAAPCAKHSHCKLCTDENCMWCSTTRRCINMNAYMISFPYGQCSAWVSKSSANVNACVFDPSDCEVQQTCKDCQEVGPGCGWCDDGSGTGLGKCVAGSLNGPFISNTSLATVRPAPALANICPFNRWFFIGCPACQCNGHSNCSANRTAKLAKMTLARKADQQFNNGSQCHKPCNDNTSGDHCQVCKGGFFGNALNGGNCSLCQCNGQATNCDPHSGECYCTTKGVSGSHCDKCEQKYYGDPKNNTCYYELAIDFIFTFNLDDSDSKDKYVNRINFFSRPYKKDTDVSFAILCESGVAKVNLSMISNTFTSSPNMERRFLANQPCDKTGIRRTFSAGEPDFEFGTDANTTFLVYVHDFKTPIKIQISFAQSPPINWVLFFVIFAACFIVLLVVAGLLWMIKLRIDVYRRRQRMFVEIEQMASRPFGTVRLELTKTGHPTNKFASPISVEPCANYKAAVVTVAVRLPTGGRKFTPSGTSGLAVASSLCLLTPGQVGVLQAPPSPDPNEKRKHRLRRLWFCRR